MKARVVTHVVVRVYSVRVWWPWSLTYPLAIITRSCSSPALLMTSEATV